MCFRRRCSVKRRPLLWQHRFREFFPCVSSAFFAPPKQTGWKQPDKPGNSLALVIEKPVLDLLGAGPESSFDITTDGHALVLIPIKDAKRQKAFRPALGKVNEKHSNAPKRLAE